MEPENRPSALELKTEAPRYIRGGRGSRSSFNSASSIPENALVSLSSSSSSLVASASPDDLQAQVRELQSQVKKKNEKIRRKKQAVIT